MLLGLCCYKYQIQRPKSNCQGELPFSFNFRSLILIVFINCLSKSNYTRKISFIKQLFWPFDIKFIIKLCLIYSCQSCRQYRLFTIFCRNQNRSNIFLLILFWHFLGSFRHYSGWWEFGYSYHWCFWWNC